VIDRLSIIGTWAVNNVRTRLIGVQLRGRCCSVAHPDYRHRALVTSFEGRGGLPSPACVDPVERVSFNLSIVIRDRMHKLARTGPLKPRSSVAMHLFVMHLYQDAQPFPTLQPW